MLEAGLYDLFIQDYISKPKQTRSFGDQEVQIYDLKNWTTLSDFNTTITNMFNTDLTIELNTESVLIGI